MYANKVTACKGVNKYNLKLILMAGKRRICLTRPGGVCLGLLGSWLLRYIINQQLRIAGNKQGIRFFWIFDGESIF